MPNITVLVELVDLVELVKNVELVENTMMNIGLVRLFPREWPKIGRGTAN